jgi:hypothetical protein
MAIKSAGVPSQGRLPFKVGSRGLGSPANSGVHN